MQITRGDGTQMLAHGLDDPQAMRMILLQILTGRRASEIRTCAFDCLSPLPDRATATADDTAADSEEIVRFHYAQIQDRHRTGQHPRRPRGHPGHRGATAVDPGAVRRHRATLPVPAAPRQPHRDQALPVGHLRLDAARVQQHRQDHRQQGPAGRAEPHPPVPAHQADPPGRARPAHPRPAALRRARHPDDVDALHRPTRGARRAGVPGHREAQGRRHPRVSSPARTTTACTCSTGPTGSCPTAGACCRRCRPATRATPA